MAQRTQVRIISDLTGAEDSNAETVTFAIDGASYEIDLTGKEAEDFRDALSKYSDVARRTGGGSARRAEGSGSTASKSSSRGHLDAVRAGARDNGHTVSDRGRISGKVLDAYKAANG